MCNLLGTEVGSVGDIEASPLHEEDCIARA